MAIYSEGCGAYCSSGETYFNFDLRSGKKILITDVIDKTRIDSFRALAFNDKVKALNNYMEEERESFKRNELDSSTYDWISDEVGNCIKGVQIENFSLSDQSIVINDSCEFPNAIKSQNPVYELKYSSAWLYPFLNPKFKKILSSGY